MDWKLVCIKRKYKQVTYESIHRTEMSFILMSTGYLDIGTKTATDIQQKTIESTWGVQESWCLQDWLIAGAALVTSATHTTGRQSTVILNRMKKTDPS